MGIKEELKELENKIGKDLEEAHKKMTTFKKYNTP